MLYYCRIDVSEGIDVNPILVKEGKFRPFYRKNADVSKI